MAFWYGHTADDHRERIYEGDTPPKMWSEGGDWTFRSSRYDSLEQLQADSGMQESCVECGGLISLKWMKDVVTRLLAQRVCLNCDFWRGVLAEDRSITPIVEGRAYSICPDQPEGYQGFLGFGGQEFRILFKDGRAVTTRNLWHRGDVPEWFRERLPDTAVFVMHEGQS